jgi:hypothetical protein
VWFDASGLPYTAFVGSPPACGSGGRASTSTSMVFRGDNGTWTAAGQGVLQTAYARGGWQATLTGPAAIGQYTGTTLTLTHAKDTLTIPGAGPFAWSP